MNARSCSIIGAVFCCYCNIRASDSDRGDENSSSSLSEVSSYENVWFSSSKRIVAKLD